MLVNTMISSLKKRLFDIDGYTDAEFATELDLAQSEFLNRIDKRLLGAIIVKDEKIVFDENGEFVLSGLDNTILDYNESILSLDLYIKDTLALSEARYPALSVDDDQVRKLKVNDFFIGTNEDPKYMVIGSKLKVFAGNCEIKVSSEIAYGDQVVAALAGERLINGGPLFPDDDYYGNFFLYNPLTGNSYKIAASELVGGLIQFTITTEIAVEDQVTSWQLLTPYKNNYCGTGLISYIKKPTTLTVGGSCDLEDKYAQLVLTMAEATIWMSDGKMDNATIKSGSATNQINLLNGMIKPTDNVGYRAIKY